MALFGTGSNITNTTSVAAGNYGSANAVPSITVDANQRISAINTNAITLTAAINANASVGDIGTYAFMQQSSGNTQYAPGATLAGSSLRYSDATGRIHTTTPAGNWRCMGYDSGAALVNTGTGTGTGTGSGSISGTLQGGNVQGNTSLSGGNVQGNTSVQGGKGAGGGVPTNNLGVAGNVTTDNLGVGGNVGGNATINTVSVNSITVNTTVAYSATLWLRYS